MKISNIDSQQTKYLTFLDLENFLNIFTDKNNNFKFNLNETLFLDVNNRTFPIYLVKTPCHWPLISYNLYGTTRLAWFLMKLNQVECKDIFKKKYPGDKIKYLSQQNIEQLFTKLIGF